MKKSFISSAIACLLLISCSSDDSTMDISSVSVKDIPISINLSSNDEFTVLRSSSPEDAGLKSMTYVVYKGSDGSFVKYKSITSGDKSLIKDTLPEGQYKIAIFASNLPNLNIYPSFDIEDFPGGNTSYNEASFFCHHEYGPRYDHFYKDFSINVGTDNSQSVVLERVTSKIEIIPQDKSIPEGVTNIAFYIDHLAAQQFSFSTKKTINSYANIESLAASSQFPTNTYYTKYYSESEFEQNGNISLFLFPFSSSDITNEQFKGEKASLCLSYFYNNKNYTKKIKSDFTLENNKILRLTGYLFSTDGNLNNSILVDTEWDATVDESDFDK